MTFLSYDEIFNPAKTLAKSRFIDYFDGSVLNPIWTTANIVGVNTFAMSDSVDGGFIMTMGTNGLATIYFNNKRNFSNVASSFISTFSSNNVNGFHTFAGLCDTNDGTGTCNEVLAYQRGTASITAQTQDGSGTANAVSTGLTPDTSFHVYRGFLNSTVFNLTVDGVLKASSTTRLPTVKMQPIFEGADISSSAANTCQIRYFEAYNY